MGIKHTSLFYRGYDICNDVCERAQSAEEDIGGDSGSRHLGVYPRQRENAHFIRMRLAAVKADAKTSAKSSKGNWRLKRRKGVDRSWKDAHEAVLACSNQRGMDERQLR